MQQDNTISEQLLAELADLRQRVAIYEAKEANEQKLETSLSLRQREIAALIGVTPQTIIARFDPQLRHTYIHHAIKPVSGISAEAYLGKTSREMGMPEPAITAWERALESAFVKGTEHKIEYEIGVGQQRRTYEALIIPEPNSKQVVESVLTLTRDISHQKQAEEALSENFQILETVHHVGQVLAAELDLQKLVQAVTDSATELSRAEIGAFFYNLVDEQGESYTLYTISGMPRDHFARFPMPRNTEVFGPTFRGDGTLRMDDVRKDPRYGKSSPYYGMPKGHFPVVSYLAVPVISQTQEVLGGLFFGHSKVGVFTERDERVVEGLAAQAAIAMDNARLYRETQQQRERLDVTLASIGDAVITTDAEGTITFINQVAEELTGWASPAVIGKSLDTIFHVVDAKTREALVSPFEKVRQEGSVVRVTHDVLLLTREGRALHIDQHGAPILDDSHKITGFVLAFHDVTARRENEARINLLLELATRFSKAVTSIEITQIVIEQATKSLGVTVASLAQLVEQESMLELLHLAGVSSEIAEKYRYTPLNFTNPMNEAVQTNRIVWIETLADYLRSYPHFADAIQANGSQSIICLPLTVNEKVVGGLSLSFPTEKRRNPAEEIFFTALAQLCAQALERARLYESTAQMGEQLQLRVRLQSVISELGQEALVSFDLPNLMNKAVQLLAHHLGVEYTKILELLPDKKQLLLKAGVGWKAGLVGQAKVSAGRESQAGYTLLSQTPVIVENLKAEMRFDGPPLLFEHQVVSGMSVIIQGQERPWGVLGIHSTQSRTFTKDDIYFIQSVANILGNAIERNRLDVLLETQRQWLENVIATVPGVIWENHHTDEQAEMKLVFISAYIENLLGYTAEEALAEPHFWSKIFHPEDAEETAKAFNRVRQSRGSGVVNFRAIHKSGRIIDVQALMTTLIKDDKPIGKRGVMMDVSERQRLMTAQLRSAALLRRSNEELQQFAYVASHDLQEPLRMVISFLNLLESRYTGKLDSDAHEFIHFAIDGALRMKALITSLLEYSRLDSIERAFAKFDVQLALNDALTDLAFKIEESGAVITSDPMPSIQADQVQITQLFQNLIGNAIKFQKGKRPEVHIGVERKPSEWQFTVRDQGIGIAPEYLERIFVIFQRLHRKDEYPGTGIGLAICKKVVERHGGRIWVDSIPEQGTTFYFTIPIR